MPQFPTRARVTLGDGSTREIFPPQVLEYGPAGVLQVMSAGKILTAWSQRGWVAVNPIDVDIREAAPEGTVHAHDADEAAAA